MGFGFRKLDLYKDIREYVVYLYKIAEYFPGKEKFGLGSQLTRAASSILLNFSEGMMASYIKERKRFLQIGISSIGEIVAIVDLASDLKYLTASQHEEILLKSEIIIKRLYGLKRKVK